MAYIVHEDDLWPVVLVVASGYYSIKQHVASLKQWNKWLAKNETFYVVQVFLDIKSMQFCKDISESTTRWLQLGAKEKIEQNVAAMAVVMPKAYKEIKASTSQRKFKLEYSKDSIYECFGVSGDVFTSLDAAYNYLQTLPNFNADETLSTLTKYELQRTLDTCIHQTKNSKSNLV